MRSSIQNIDITDKFPNFLIIGTQRGGTTFLHNILSKHPQLLPARSKEVHFFTLHYHNSPEWYCGKFQEKKTPDQLTFESTPFYLYFPPVPERVFNTIPKTKFIVCLRNPVERTWSAYKNILYKGRTPEVGRSFYKAIQKEIADIVLQRPIPSNVKKAIQGGIVRRSIYSEQLKRWYQFFLREQFLIIKSEDLFTTPQQVYKQVLEFVGVEQDKPQLNVDLNRSSSGEIDNQSRELLETFFGKYPSVDDLIKSNND